MDDEFFHHSAHLDIATIQIIVKGQYVDLAKILPREKILHNDGRLQMVHKEGAAYLHLLPVTEKNTPQITSLRRWEQAFEIYATIYTEAHPDRAHELFKHMYNIRAASATFIWENVYSYDITFRRLMERHPTRNWGIIYQQGWSIMLKEMLQIPNMGTGSFNKRRQSSKRDQVCWKYNRGHCNHGSNCRFEHKCSGCEKNDHGFNSCSMKKTKNDKQQT